MFFHLFGKFKFDLLEEMAHKDTDQDVIMKDVTKAGDRAMYKYTRKLRED